MSKEWTEAHQREALRRTYEIAAELASEGRAQDAATLVQDAAGYSETEGLWCHNLSFAEVPWPRSRIGREVRRVRALAEGRLVRESGWRAALMFNELSQFHADKDAARDEADENGDGEVVRVTRIRRAT